jgi:uncharacterized membrane protein YcaP (DUF421 family)
VNSEPTVLAAAGRFIPKHLDQERVSPDEVYTEMRKVGLAELSQVKWAILEPDGKISIVPQENN